MHETTGVPPDPAFEMPRRNLSLSHADWLHPDWPVTGAGALMSTRAGGVSRAPWDTLNLGSMVGDDPEAVAHNRQRLAQAIGAQPVFLNQVHGNRVVHLGSTHARPGAPIEVADAAITTQPGLACVVQVADCLPVLFATPDGRAVGAAHAGWRGLASGVLEATLGGLCTLAHCTPAEVHVWLGACIGPAHFEVGPDVPEAFGSSAAVTACFRVNQQAKGKWLADLPALARVRLQQAGVTSFSGGGWCTVSEGSRFFSYRRDRITGRQAAAVWIER